jgi:hypothetical protein
MQVPADGRLAKLDVELEPVAVNAGCAQSGVGEAHPTDQVTDFRRSSWGVRKPSDRDRR